MPHKFSLQTACNLNIYIQHSCKRFIYKHKQTITLCNIRFHTEITLNIDMQHIQGNTHKHTDNYNHIYDNP